MSLSGLTSLSPFISHVASVKKKIILAIFNTSFVHKFHCLKYRFYRIYLGRHSRVMNMSKSKFLSPNCRHTEVCPVHLSGLRQRLSRERIRLQCRWVRSLGQEDPLEKEWQPTPVFLPEKSHGQRSLAGYSPRSEEHTSELQSR